MPDEKLTLEVVKDAATELERSNGLNYLGVSNVS